MECSCSRCGKPASVYIGEASAGGRLVWSRAFVCEHCGAAWEEDGHGVLPPELREVVLQQQGEWCVDVLSGDSGTRVRALQVLRELLGLTVVEAKPYLKRIPGTVARGTQGEMERLARRLRELRVEVEVKRLAGQDAS
ncbi:hypothetical protein NR798_38110 [Archangium gephyra]|uniref:hypothetical protein n=1 Tax=Archangium gephyra TaxID=48 RepID=UPI0035D4E170